MHLLGSLVSLILFGLALVIIHHKLRQYHAQDIGAELLRMRPAALFWAVGLTVLNYLALSLYDILALRYIHHPLPYSQVMLGSSSPMLMSCSKV